jgi:hypothetical protein
LEVPNQIRFFKTAQKLLARGFEIMEASGFSNVRPDPENPLLSRPTGTLPYEQGVITWAAYEVLQAYLDACSTSGDVDALYKISLSLRHRRDRLGDYAERTQAMEHAIWDAKYRFEEHCLRLTETSAKFSPIARLTDIAVAKKKVRNSIKRLFDNVRKNRGINTHERLIPVPIPADISTLNLLSRFGPTKRLFDDEQIGEFLWDDVRTRVLRHRHHSRRNAEKYFITMHECLEATCAFALDICEYDLLVELALAELNSVIIPVRDSPGKSQVGADYHS